jgi:hypothetical protein
MFGRDLLEKVLAASRRERGQAEDSSVSVSLRWNDPDQVLRV